MTYFLTLFFCLLQLTVFCNDDLICLTKKNVPFRFVRVDETTDHFAQTIFPDWKNQDFEVFDRVKDPQGIAIDIGAWIGTASIWLSHNFSHVVAVEPDHESLRCLRNNLDASECFNVTICSQPISHLRQRVIFGSRLGPQGFNLNQSISKIKLASEHENDTIIKSLTFKNLIYDYVIDNESISGKNISFINCDIGGGEEDVLEDILHFAYHNKCKVYLSFNLHEWRSKKIHDFDYLFKFFKTNCPSNNVSEYLSKHPFESLLFEPLEKGEQLVKKNMTALIVGYNQPTFIRNMVKQLEGYTTDIVVVDNNSTFKPLLDYYDIEFKYTLLKQRANFGPYVYISDRIRKISGEIYILTDPDLKFNQQLPNNFIDNLVEISNYFQTGRVGFALFADSDDIRTDPTAKGVTIREWEKQFWINRLDYPPHPEMELYRADVDTTFCLVNLRLPNYPIRVGGDYTCFHIPWHKNFHKQLMEGEYESYLRNNVTPTCFRLPDEEKK